MEYVICLQSLFNAQKFTYVLIDIKMSLFLTKFSSILKDKCNY